MARKVEVQLPSGEWVVRTSEDISEEELEYPMRCCGKNKEGNLCHAPMVPVRLKKPYPHITFRQKNGEKVHILGCEFDEQREKQIVSHLDRRATGFEPEDIWKLMGEKRTKENGKGKKIVGPAGPDGGGEEPGGAEPNPRDIQRKSTLPKSPESLAEILLELPIDEVYANARVGDLILDQRTVVRFRCEGIPEDAYVLALAKRLAQSNRTFVTNKYEFVLVDCMYDAAKEPDPHACIQFRLNLFGEARDDMFKFLKLKGDNTYIVIYSRWEKDPDNANTYFAIDADVDHIGRIRLPDPDET